MVDFLISNAKRAIVAMFFVCMALPAAAQQERECRGKKAFDLGDGSYGCLLEVAMSTITTTTTYDDGGSSKPTSRAKQAGAIVVAMFGTQSSSNQVNSARMKTICQTFLPDLKAAHPNNRYRRIILRLVWPKTETVQAGFSSAKCKGVRFFG
jgi:hypothetical protein